MTARRSPENTAILPYLGKRFGLWPTDALGEAKLLSLIGYFAAAVHPAFAHVGRPERYSDDPSDFPALRDKGLKTFHGYLKDIDARLAGREWLSDRYSVVDPYALVFYAWGKRRELPVGGIEELHRVQGSNAAASRRPADARRRAGQAMRSPRMRAHLGMISLFASLCRFFTARPGARPRRTPAAQTPAAQKPAPIADKPKASACDRHAFRAVIDVGHTLKVGGATSARGIYEYEFNLRLAKQVVQKLTDAGFDRTVLLITTEPARSALFKRSSRANTMGADLFLAIHHDSVPDPMLEKWTYDGVEHTYNDRFPGHSIFISNDNPQRGRSLEFASLLGAQLKARGLKYTPHYTERFMGHRQRVLVDAVNGVYRYDQLIVLRTTHMPAVLLEAGSIINRKEEVELAKPERVALVADAALDAVETYCDTHGHNIAEARRTRPTRRRRRDIRRGRRRGRPPACASKIAIALRAERRCTAALVRHYCNTRPKTPRCDCPSPAVPVPFCAYWGMGAAMRRNRHVRGACAIGCALFSGALIDAPTAARADEGGVSFWIPGFYASLAAAPLEPGWALTSMNYFDQVKAGGDVALARNITIRAVDTTFNVESAGEHQRQPEVDHRPRHRHPDIHVRAALLRRPGDGRDVRRHRQYRHQSAGADRGLARSVRFFQIRQHHRRDDRPE